MISVIIPVFDGERYIAQAIESVLDQTLPPDEVFVVDDGSQDGTREAIARYGSRVHYHHQSNLGSGAARNWGIRESKGDLLAFLDADDLWLPRRLELQKAALDEDPGLDLVFCHMSQFRSPELSPDEKANLLCDETPQPAPLISCLLARRSAFERVGPLRTDVKADFIDWYLNAQDMGLRMRTVDVPLVRRRIHPRNFSLTSKTDVRREYLFMLKASLDRRRVKTNSGIGPRGQA